MSFKLIRFIGITGMLISFSSHARTLLSGDILQDSLHASGNPYIVEQDLTIPKDKKCVVDAGCVFLFKQFTGMIVNGTLVVEGAEGEGVVFTSVLDPLHIVGDTLQSGGDSAQSANPFDWKGIDVLSGSIGTSLSYASILYTVNGINSRTPHIKINNCYFDHTGQYDVIIDGQIYNVTHGTPFSFSPPNDKPVTPPVRHLTLKDCKKSLHYGALAVGAVGVVVGTIMAALAANDWDHIEKMKPGVINPETGEEYTRTEVDNAIAEFNAKKSGSIVGFSFGGVGIIGFGLTFLIK